MNCSNGRVIGVWSDRKFTWRSTNFLIFPCSLSWIQYIQAMLTLFHTKRKSWDGLTPHPRGYTLAETIMVVLIVGIVLSMIVFMSTNYLKELQVRSEKEEIIDWISYVTSFVKSSNYFQGNPYDYLRVTVNSDYLRIHTLKLSWDDLLLPERLFFEDVFDKIRLEFASWVQEAHVLLTPYERACYIYDGESLATVDEDEPVLSFTGVGIWSEHAFCAERDMQLCKLRIVPCD